MTADRPTVTVRSGEGSPAGRTGFLMTVTAPRDRYTTDAAKLRQLADWLETERTGDTPRTLLVFSVLALKLQRLSRDAADFAAVFPEYAHTETPANDR